MDIWLATRKQVTIIACPYVRYRIIGIFDKSYHSAHLVISFHIPDMKYKNIINGVTLLYIYFPSFSVISDFHSSNF